MSLFAETHQMCFHLNAQEKKVTTENSDTYTLINVNRGNSGEYKCSLVDNEAMTGSTTITVMCKSCGCFFFLFFFFFLDLIWANFMWGIRIISKKEIEVLWVFLHTSLGITVGVGRTSFFKWRFALLVQQGWVLGREPILFLFTDLENAYTYIFSYLSLLFCKHKHGKSSRKDQIWAQKKIDVYQK